MSCERPGEPGASGFRGQATGREAGPGCPLGHGKSGTGEATHVLHLKLHVGQTELLNALDWSILVM